MCNSNSVQTVERAPQGFDAARFVDKQIVCRDLTKGQLEVLARNDVMVIETHDGAGGNHFDGTVLIVRETCGSCGGTGQYWTMRGTAEVCFGCWGRKQKWTSAITVARRLRAKELKDAKRIAKEIADAPEKARREKIKAESIARWEAKEEERKAKELKEKSKLNWIDGEVKDRVTMELKIVGRDNSDDLHVWSGEGQFGTSYLYRFETRDGDVVSLFTSAYPFDCKSDKGIIRDGERVGVESLVRSGDWFKATFTIKDFETYKDTKQTQVQRLKFVENLSAEIDTYDLYSVVTVGPYGSRA